MPYGLLWKIEATHNALELSMHEWEDYWKLVNIARLCWHYLWENYLGKNRFYHSAKILKKFADKLFTLSCFLNLDRSKNFHYRKNVQKRCISWIQNTTIMFSFFRFYRLFWLFCAKIGLDEVGQKDLIYFLNIHIKWIKNFLLKIYVS